MKDYKLKVANYSHVPLYTAKGASKAKAYFGRVRKGQPQVYETSFAESESTKKLLSTWKEQLSNGLKEWPSLMEFENDLAGKVGPLSVMLPLSRRIDDIESYYKLIHEQSQPILPKAIQAVVKEWMPAKGARVRTSRHTLEAMKLSTNSGNPFHTKRRDVVGFVDGGDAMMDKSSYGPEPYQIFARDVQVGRGRYNMLPAIAELGWRGQEGGITKSDVKQRVVWMFPFEVNLQELRVYQPLIEVAQLHDVVPAWVSMESVDRRITKLFDTKAEDDLVICTDFSKFDQHFNSDMSDAAKSVLTALLCPDVESRYWLEEIFPIKYNIPMLADYQDRRDLLLYYGTHGMGSGSGGTNFDETLAHRSLQYEAAILQSKTLNPNSMCLGDDGILSYPSIALDDVISSYTSHGQEMNPDKQYVSKEDCVYLRRWHHRKYRMDGVCVGVYSTCRALGRLRYLERFYDPEHWGREAVALRQLSILENCKYHPMREEFVQFCMKRDKYRLGLDIPGFLGNVGSIAKEFKAYMPDFLGYTKSQQRNVGLDSWWIIKYLRSL